jgi:phosphomannomutase
MKHYFFDLDGTVCESTQKISQEMKDYLSRLESIVIISGAKLDKMEWQLDGLECPLASQNGNSTEYWQNTLSKSEKVEIWAHIKKMTAFLEQFNGDVEIVQDRGCQISLSFTGHNAPLEYKKRFDPSGEKRRDILDNTPFRSKALKCCIAGTTCLDYIGRKNDKGHNIERYIRQMKWQKEDCLFFGDKLMPGGNDSSVVGVIKTVEVLSPKDLLNKLKIYEKGIL